MTSKNGSWNYWTVYQAHNNSPLNLFIHDRFSYTVLSHTDLSREGGRSGDIDLSLINWGRYDLIMIDESHNFRNNARGKRDEDGQVIRRTRYERLMDDIITKGPKTKVLDLEDFNESIALTDFSLDDFRLDLAKFIDQNKASLSKEPAGLYAVASHTWSSYPAVGPGVIFCLQQRGAATEGQQINPLQPFYLVYVLDDGTVRLGFSQPKQILELFRDLCLGHDRADQTLCGLFDCETQDGAAMEPYSERLMAALRDIKRRFRSRAADQLTSGGRGALLLAETKQARANDDFELVTWLVIR